jgi:hypothetical protein
LMATVTQARPSTVGRESEHCGAVALNVPAAFADTRATPPTQGLPDGLDGAIYGL